MNKKEIKKLIESSDRNFFTKADLYNLFSIENTTTNSAVIPEFINFLEPEKEISKDLIVSFGNYSIAINERLLDKQNVRHNLEKIKKLHLEKMKIFTKMEKTDDKESLRKLTKDVEKIEFKLQEAWEFEKNADFHRWYEVPKCECPKMDNEDYYGTKYRSYIETCPIHGTK